MVLSTPAFPDGGVVPNRHTQVQQAERGISPQLVWTNAPAETQSFVLHMHDPEVARNRTTDDQVHWLVWNIAGTEKGLPEGVPEGAQLPNGMRQISASGAVYRGPGAPAAGPQHHYTFEVYALDTKLDVPPGADAWETRRRGLQSDGWSRHRQGRDGGDVQAATVREPAVQGSRFWVLGAGSWFWVRGSVLGSHRGWEPRIWIQKSRTSTQHHRTQNENRMSLFSRLPLGSATV